tara:strand:+ start:420 stop:575 length:156 start_codon:yes stop_codon:yes gene_type:complete
MPLINAVEVDHLFKKPRNTDFMPFFLFQIHPKPGTTLLINLWDKKQMIFLK